jgi:hypothetical protein
LAASHQEVFPTASDAAGRPSWGGLLLAGLATGVLAASIAVAYHMLDGMLRADGPWRYLNLEAAGLFGRRALTGAFSKITLAGLSLHVLEGAIVGVAAAWPLAKLSHRPYVCRTAGVLIGLGWYFLSFRLLWTDWNPALVIRQPFPGALLGHVVYGFCLGLLPRALEEVSTIPLDGRQ